MGASLMLRTMINAGDSTLLRDYLPPVYRKLLPGLFDAAIPRETRATCEDCVMCAKGAMPPGKDPLERKFFSPSTKCCTFHPSLPNFLAGAVLASVEPGMEEGRRRLRAKIERGIGVTPRGILAPRKYSVLYEQGSEFFGRSEAMLCPYYDRGNCTIWLHREAVCTTYFCKYERGVEGKELWDELKRYLGVAELKLSLFAVTRLEQRPDRLARIWDIWEHKGPVTHEEIEERDISPERRSEIWGEWAGREEEFYLECHRTIEALDRASFEGLIGVDERFQRAKLEVSIAKVISGELPARLRKNPELKAVRAGENYLCSVTRVGDAFEVNGLIFPLLEAFDGTQGYQSVLDEISREKKIMLPLEIVTKLYHLGLLVAG